MFQDARPSDDALLIIAVLHRAIMDLLSELAATGEHDRGHARHEAIRFLTDEKGEWARSRAHLCDLVGLDHTILREKIIKILDGDDNALPEYRVKTVHLEETRRVWAEMKRKAAEPKVLKKGLPRINNPLDDLLKLTAEPEAAPPPPSPGRTRLLERRARRIQRICELLDEGLSVQEMAERERVHHSTISDRLSEAMDEGRVRRASMGGYTTVPQTSVAACR